MSTKKQRNKFRDDRKKTPPQAGAGNPLELAMQAAEKSESVFVRNSVEALVEAAAYLSTVAGADNADISTKEDRENALNDYGKAARLVDLIAVVSAAAGAKYTQQNLDAQHVRHLVDAALAGVVGVDANGCASLTRVPLLGVAVATRSRSGAWIARQINRISKADRLPPPMPRDQLLSEAQTNYKAGQLEMAMRQYQEIIAREPKNILALRQLAVVYCELNYQSKAIDCCRQALRLDNSIALQIDLANALWGDMDVTPAQKRDRAEALSLYKEVLRLEPGNIQILTNIASAHLGSDDSEAAEAAFTRIVQLNPDFPPALTGMGMIKALQFKYEEAASLFVKASRIDPSYIEALANLAFIRRYQGQLAQANELYDRAIKIKPRHTELWRYKAFYLMDSGRYREGWDLYERERALDLDHQRVNPFPAKPAWDGKPDPNLRLLIWHEQGYGDSLQFIRYAAICKKYVGKVLIHCPKSLISLFKNCPFVDEVVSGAFAFQFDAQVAMMSLPSLLQAIDQPLAEIPYLFISEQKKRYADRLMANSPRGALKVGLVWAGNPRKKELGNYRVDRRRSMHLETMRPLFDIQGVTFFNLQKDEPATQIDACGLRDRFVDLMPQSNNYEETGAIVENLDLVIGVDTSLVHLAGGLGKPVWVLSRYDACWRWLRNQADSPWYPTARVFGQKKPGDWDTVIAEVRVALEALVSQAKPIKDETLTYRVGT